jgi:hypothetical protein
LPSCRCATANAPVQNPPQFLLLAYDDAIQSQTYPQATSLFANRKNPNGCPAHATWFVSTYYSDPALVQKWTSSMNEYADHSMTHDPYFDVFLTIIDLFAVLLMKLKEIELGLRIGLV